MKTSMITRIAIFPLVLLLGSCSEEGLNEFVEAEMKPSSPVLIYTDTKKGTGDDAEDIKGPWFIAGFKITNKHPKYALIIPSVQLDYVGYFGSSKYDGELLASADTFCGDIDGASRSLYAELAPATASGNTVFYGDANCNGVNDGQATDNETAYFHGLKAPTDKDDKINSYRIKATFNGYFVDANEDIIGNVELIRYYSTR